MTPQHTTPPVVCVLHHGRAVGSWSALFLEGWDQGGAHASISGRTTRSTLSCAKDFAALALLFNGRSCVMGVGEAHVPPRPFHWRPVGPPTLGRLTSMLRELLVLASSGAAAALLSVPRDRPVIIPRDMNTSRAPSSLVAQKSRVLTALRHAPMRPVVVARRTLATKAHVSSTKNGESRRAAMIGGISAAVVVLASTGDAIAAGRAVEPPCDYKTAVHALALRGAPHPLEKRPTLLGPYARTLISTPTAPIRPSSAEPH
jgi:hypothetical protein